VYVCDFRQHTYHSYYSLISFFKIFILQKNKTKKTTNRCFYLWVCVSPRTTSSENSSVKVAGSEASQVEVPQPVAEEELITMIEAGTLDPCKVYRNIMSDKPRVTRFQIDWTPESMQSAFSASFEQQEQEQEQQQEQQQAYMEQQQQQQIPQPYQQEMVMSGGLPVPPMYGSGYEQPQPPSFQEGSMTY